VRVVIGKFVFELKLNDFLAFNFFIINFRFEANIPDALAAIHLYNKTFKRMLINA
jgi:hypothetical protein